MMKTSDDAHDLLPWYVARTLDDQERSAFEAHLATCASCRQELEFLERVRGEFELHGEALLEPHPPAEQVVALARGELDSADAPAVRRHVALCAACATETRWITSDTAAQPAARSGSAPHVPAVRSRPWVWLAAAAVLAAIAILTPWRHSIEPSRIRHPAFLIPPERAIGAKPNVVTPEPGDGRVSLILELDLPETAFPVDLAIVDKSGRTVHAVSRIGKDSILQGTYLFVDCSPTDCAPGSYTARITGSAGGVDLQIPFEVASTR